jgi:hypothetical protein
VCVYVNDTVAYKAQAWRVLRKSNILLFSRVHEGSVQECAAVCVVQSCKKCVCQNTHTYTHKHTQAAAAHLCRLSILILVERQVVHGVKVLGQVAQDELQVHEACVCVCVCACVCGIMRVCGRVRGSCRYRRVGFICECMCVCMR